MKVYCGASVTADLTSDNSMVRAGANANEIIYPTDFCNRSW